jgi:N utilization substance protein B
MSTAQQQLIAARHKARHYATQALYKWHMTGADAAQIEAEFLTEYDMSKVDREYFHDLLHGVVLESEMLNGLFREHLDRTLEELGAVELALLQAGCFELKNRLDVPYRVVLNENVNLAKKFGATDSHKYINGVLDKVARDTRQVEVEQAGRGAD